jgi:hypothetical protein
MKIGRISTIFVAASLLPMTARAQFTLTGVTLYGATADGARRDSSIWNTRGGSDLSYNVYLFTGTVAEPLFLNGGNTDASLNPNLDLAPGVHIIRFSGETAPGGNLGLNLYFNNDRTNRITAFVPIDGSSQYSVVRAGLITFGINGSQPSSGKLSFAVGNLAIVLTDFRVTFPRVDLVGGYAPVPDAGPDTTGSFTLTVGPRPLESAVEVSEVRVCWYAATNTTYQLQYRSSVTTNLWVDLGSPIPGDDSRKCVNDPVNPAQPHRFYQVVALP